MAVACDTSFLVDLGRGKAEARLLLEALQAEDEALLVPTVVLAEYLAGSRDPAADMEDLDAATHILPFSREDAAAAAEVAKRALAAGRFPGWTDVMLAGFAESRGLEIATGNARHFPGARTRTY